MRIKKLSETPLEQAEREYAAATAAHIRAVTDYNIMMGTLEDPSEEEEDKEDE